MEFATSQYMTAAIGFAGSAWFLIPIYFTGSVPVTSEVCLDTDFPEFAANARDKVRSLVQENSTTKPTVPTTEA